MVLRKRKDFIEQTAVQLDHSTIAGRVALDRETVHIADVLEDRDLRTDVLSGINFRTGLGVPLLLKSELIGLLLLAREEQQPFSRRQIELVEVFADQAVIDTGGLLRRAAGEVAGRAHPYPLPRAR